MVTGDASLRAAFVKQPLGTAAPGETLFGNVPLVILIERGVAYRSHTVAGERRVILDLLLPGDFAGFENALVGEANTQLVAAETLAYRAVTVEQFDKLTKKRAVWIGVAAALIEERSRMDRLATIRRLEARARIAAFLLDLYDRLRRLGLISQPRFNLPLTQGNVADYLGMTPEHFNRTLADMRDAGQVEIDRRSSATCRSSSCARSSRIYRRFSGTILPWAGSRHTITKMSAAAIANGRRCERSLSWIERDWYSGTALHRGPSPATHQPLSGAPIDAPEHHFLRQPETLLGVLAA
jgi:CRP-like cAMP-binding protein